MTGDPLDQLRLQAEPRRPSERFATALRARLVGAFGTPAIDTAVTDLSDLSDLPDHEKRNTEMDEITMPDTSETETSGGAPASVLTPYIAVSPAEEAIAWYGTVFGAVERIRYTGDDGRIGHAELDLGGALLMLSDGYPELGVETASSLGGTPVTLHLSVPDVDAVYQRATAAGATTEGEPEDKAYGARSVSLRDPFGYRWMVQTPTATPTTEEIQANMEGFTIAERGDEG